MRYQGKITNWKDDQGFGFVTPNCGGQKAFVHIKVFTNRSSRPSDGDLITYELTTDDNNRFCAKNIRFVGERTQSSPINKNSFIPISFAIAFCILLTIFALIGRLPLALIYLYLASSTMAFFAYAIDKSAAKNNRWRTKESTLHLLALIGGWPGALFAQRMIRHKSKKVEFQTVFWATVVINCASLLWLIFTKNGAIFLNAFLS